MSDSSVPFPLTKRSWISLISVLIVQAQNAFNDNFVKFILIGMAMAVAANSPIGKNVEFILTAMIPAPFILFAPLAGWVSDRFSKKRVIWWCVVAQASLFAFIALAVLLRRIDMAIFGFFLLAVQSTIFSPAKQGILKELVGTEKLSFANGMMSMLTMVGILGGMIASGIWFDTLLGKYNNELGVLAENAWKAALIPIIGIGAFSLIALAVCPFIQKTPEHPGEKFTHSIWFRHFVDLKALFSDRVLRTTALFITWYWFFANFLGLGFISFARVMQSDSTREGRLSAVGKMMMAVGLGLMAGSMLVSFLSKNRIRLPFVPIGGIGMALGLVGAGLLDPGSTSWYTSLGLIGFSSGFFVVPLNAHLQDTADESKRGITISALNLMTSFSGVVAISAGYLLRKLDFTPSQQLLLFVVPMIIMSYVVMRSIPKLTGTQKDKT